LKGVHTIPAENVGVEFKERYVEKKLVFALFFADLKESLQKAEASFAF
jgi:hypothetical protein